MKTPYPIQMIRGVRVGLHLLWGAATIAFAYPLIGDARRRWLKQRWSRQLLEILGLRIDAQLSGIAPGSLLVANHISWLDIYALNATRPVAFVSKSEVREWPLIGWLAAHTETVFIRRGSRQDALEASHALAQRLRAGHDVAIFPEGTTTDGARILEFRGALLQSAIEAQRPVQPVAIAYYDASGRHTAVPAYAGETTLIESLAAIIASRSLTVRLRPTPPLDPAGRSRRELAHAAHGAIAYALGLALPEVDESAARDAGSVPDFMPDETCSSSMSSR